MLHVHGRFIRINPSVDGESPAISDKIVGGLLIFWMCYSCYTWRLVARWVTPRPGENNALGMVAAVDITGIVFVPLSGGSCCGFVEVPVLICMIIQISQR